MLAVQLECAAFFHRCYKNLDNFLVQFWAFERKFCSASNFVNIQTPSQWYSAEIWINFSRGFRYWISKKINDTAFLNMRALPHHSIKKITRNVDNVTIVLQVNSEEMNYATWNANSVVSFLFLILLEHVL